MIGTIELLVYKKSIEKAIGNIEDTNYGKCRLELIALRDALDSKILHENQHTLDLS